MTNGRRKRKHSRERLEDFSVPLPWRGFVRILKNYGFEMITSSGSAARTFVKGEIKFTVHEPHGKGDKVVSKVDRKKAIFHIERIEEDK